MTSRPLGRSFFARPAIEVAPELLNKVLHTRDGRAGRIVEVEAYAGPSDPGSHAFRGPTPRTEVMFGAAGHLYVYFTYGMHWCANAVVERDGVAGAVLLRALSPLQGLDAMRKARGAAARRDRDLCSGPAKLCQALGIAAEHDGADLVGDNRGVTIMTDGVHPPDAPIQTTRVGLRNGGELPWRWYVPGVVDVSRP